MMRARSAPGRSSHPDGGRHGAGAARDPQSESIQTRPYPAARAAMIAAIMLLSMPVDTRVDTAVAASTVKVHLDDWLSPVGCAGLSGRAMSRAAPETQRMPMLVFGFDRYWRT
jgi:hypothetical protein